MTFTIPVWLLWTVGVIAGLGILFLAVVGAFFMWSVRHW
jgi:hypothetical protein